MLVLAIVTIVYGFNLYSDKQQKMNIQTARHLEGFIKSQKYEKFDISRENWGAGTVISFQKGTENIEWFNSECLGLIEFDKSTNQGHIRETKVTLPDLKYSISSDASVEAKLANAFDKGTDVNGSLKDKRVASVKINLEKPVERAVSDGTMTQKIKQLFANDQDCAQKILEPGVFVIDRIIKLGGFSYSFLSDSNTELEIDAKVLDEMGVSTAVQNQFIGKSQMVSNEPRILGYRLYQYQVEGGLGESELVGKRVTLKQIAQLKKDSVQL
jgi:hypothetical protein